MVRLWLDSILRFFSSRQFYDEGHKQISACICSRYLMFEENCSQFFFVECKVLSVMLLDCCFLLPSCLESILLVSKELMTLIESSLIFTLVSSLFHAACHEVFSIRKNTAICFRRVAPQIHPPVLQSPWKHCLSSKAHD